MLSCPSCCLFFALLVPAFVPAQTPTTQTTAPKHTVDDRIYDEVHRKLADDVDVKGAAFEINVKDGVVTLRGKVHTKHAKEKAEKITKRVKGVVKVDNQLSIFGEDDK